MVYPLDFPYEEFIEEPPYGVYEEEGVYPSFDEYPPV